MSEQGQIYFIRAVQVKKNPAVVKSCEFDITIQTTKDNQFIDDPIINYTIEFDKSNYDALDSAKFYFICEDKQIIPYDSSIIYKEIGNKKNLNVRYTSKLKEDDFLMMMNSTNKIQIVLEAKNQSVEQINEDFGQKLKELGVLIK